MGRHTDRIGTKWMIIRGRVLMYLGVIIFLLFEKNNTFLIVACIFLGVSDATGVAWRAQEAELVNIPRVQE